MGVDHPGLGITWERIKREIRRVAKATLQNASIGRAGIRVYDGGWIRIEGGGLSVTGSGVISGTLTVTGRLEGSGTLDWSGPTFLRGATSVEGNTTISGTLDVSGETTLNNNLTLGNSGRIKAGAITINPTANGGTIEIGSSEIRGGDGGVGIYPGTGAAIITSAAGVRIFSLPTISAASAGLPAGTIHIDGIGYLRRVV